MQVLIIFTLQARGAKIDARDVDGRTPLHVHCARGRVYGTACLLHQGADANAQTFDTQSTPLHIAAQHNNSEVC